MSKTKADKNVSLDLATPNPASPYGNAEPGVMGPPNIKFCGRRKFAPGKRKVVSDPAPIESFSDRGQIVTLPPADFQKTTRLFYHESAAMIVRHFPNLYKRIVKKGE